jgi:hypothetical protein
MTFGRFASYSLLLVSALLCAITHPLAREESSDANQIQEKLDTGEYPLKPEEVVKAFCRSDIRGDGLSSDSWRNLQQYTIWEDAPGWDTAVIISHFETVPIRAQSYKAEVKVFYRILGRQSGDDVTLKRNSETRIYRLQKKKGVWRITEPQLPPHISARTAIDHLEKLKSNPENNERLAGINKSINILKKLYSR